MKLTLRDPRPSGFAAPAAPLLSVAFLFLMFAIADRRLIAESLQIDDELPRAAISRAEASAPLDLRVSLRADPEGRLAQITFDGQDLGRDDAAFAQLSAAIRGRIGRSPGPLAADVAVEIDADAGLHYRHILRAVAACTGEVDPQTKSLVRAVETVRFAGVELPVGKSQVTNPKPQSSSN